MVTIYDVAKRCGVSPSTVSKAINDYPAIPDETKQRIKKIMAEMKYVPNLQAKSLSKGKSRNIGILVYLENEVTPFSHPLFGSILDSFAKYVNAKGYNILFVSHNVEGNANPSLLKNIVSRNVEGVVILGDMDKPAVKEIIDSEIRCIGFDYYGSKMAGVRTDGYTALKEVTRKLLGLGHREIAYITGREDDITEARVKGFQDALYEAKIPFNTQNLLKGDYFNQAKAVELTERILMRPSRPTAIIYPDDYTAIAGMRCIKNHGKRIPEDFSIVGFDGIEMGEYCSPRLSTVVQDTKAIGEALASSLIEEMGYQQASIKIHKSIEIPGVVKFKESVRKLR